MAEGSAWIDSVKHKICLEVDEEGTESSSVAAVELKKGPSQVVFDRPFFCAIRDNVTGSVLFMGAVVEP